METTKTAFDQVVEQHDELRVLIQELRDYLEGPRPDIGTDGGHDWALYLSEKLLQLHNKLFAHFRQEERSGFLDELELKFPRASRAIDTFRTEHGWILRDLGSILGATVVYSEGKTPENPHLRRWTLDLLNRLGQHEREETELFQKLMYEELGTGD